MHRSEEVQNPEYLVRPKPSNRNLIPTGYAPEVVLWLTEDVRAGCTVLPYVPGQSLGGETGRVELGLKHGIEVALAA